MYITTLSEPPPPTTVSLPRLIQNSSLAALPVNWSLKAEPLVVANMVFEDATSDLRPAIARLRMPVTVLYQANGSNAAAATERYRTDYAALPAARLVPVDRTAHFIMLDRPDVFAATLAEVMGEAQAD